MHEHDSSWDDTATAATCCTTIGASITINRSHNETYFPTTSGLPRAAACESLSRHASNSCCSCVVKLLDTFEATSVLFAKSEVAMHAMQAIKSRLSTVSILL